MYENQRSEASQERVIPEFVKPGLLSDQCLRNPLNEASMRASNRSTRRYDLHQRWSEADGVLNTGEDLSFGILGATGIAFA